MRNATENRISDDLVTVSIVRKEPCSIIEAHRFHFINAGRSAIKRIFLCKQFFFDEAHRTAAKYDHYIAVFEQFIPECLQN